MRPLGVTRSAGVLLVCLGVTQAIQAQPRVGVVSVDVAPVSAPELAARFQRALEQGLSRTGEVDLLPATEVAAAHQRVTAAGATPGACTSVTCLIRLAASLRATALLTLAVRVVGKNYQVTARLIDARGVVVGERARSCRICTLQEAAQTVTTVGAELARDVPRGPEGTRPPPASRPTAAGTLAPGAPASRPGATGTPAPGGGPPSTAPWAAPTPPAPTPPVPPTLMQRARGWNWRLIGIIAAGVAAAGIGAGAPLLAISGDPTCDLPNPAQTCPEVYATTGGGAVLLTLGILAGAAAGTSFYLHWRFRDQRVTVAPTPGGAVVQARSEF